MSVWFFCRADSEHSKEVVRPYDWTYTTDYRGTLIGEAMQIQVSHLDQYSESSERRLLFVVIFEASCHVYAKHRKFWGVPPPD